MDAEAALERAVREAGDRVVAALAIRFRDLDLAEEGFALACAAAVEAWRRHGTPRDPAAWLYAAGRRRAVDLTRRAKVRTNAVFDAPEPAPTPEEVVIGAFEPIPDERLRLIFVCCHPAIAVEARIALTLRTICGLAVEPLARAFLTTETAMTQRLTRAKRKIREAGVSFEVPSPEAWPERLTAVLATLEIAYAQAYGDAAGGLDTADLAVETLRLSGVLATLLADEPEVLGLAALIRFAEARRPARTDAAGAMVPLSDQDMALWDASLTGEAFALLGRAATFQRSGPYQVMAAIHAAHARRQDLGATPWEEVVALYDALMAIRPSAIVALNRAVALEHLQGPQAALAALEDANAGERLRDYAPYHVACAHLNAAIGRVDRARVALARALDLTQAPAEHAHLMRRLAALRS